MLLKYLVLTVAAIGISACDSAPSEESPVTPPVVCESPSEDGTCAEYDPVIDEEAIEDGNVNAEVEDLKEPGVVNKPE